MDNNITNIGKKAEIVVGDLKIEVEILDYKNSYGKNRYLVKPIAGSGQIWTEKLIIKD